mgnify:CR=1 FL=1|jgi:hypothetical protein|tara:strand:- start:262 stop:2349 length:2088 start_codon:yes stop_codon:yes gene_type:complete
MNITQRVTEFKKIFLFKPGIRGVFGGHGIDHKTKKKTKIQTTEEIDFDVEAHLSGKLSQGIKPADNGNWCFVDIDQKNIDSTEFCQELWHIDNKAIPFRSISGGWHAYKIFPEIKSKKELVKEQELLEKKLSKKFSVDVKSGLPKHNRYANAPFFGNERLPYDSRGNPINFEQFKHRIKYINHPVIVAAINQDEGGRHDALYICSLYCEYRLKDINIINEVNANFAKEVTDQYFLDRFLEKEYHKKYDENYLDRNLENYLNRLNKFESENTDDLSALHLEEYTGKEEILERPWIIYGWILRKALTLIVGQPGIGKTMLMHMIAWCLCTGIKILGKEILERGNVLILCPEETKNEIRMRLKAMSQFLGKDDGKFKIYIRGLEDAIKLVKFGLTDAMPTKDYKKLKKALIKLNIKHIILDPLISFQTGNYDENSNQKMEQYIKNYLIPFAVEMDGSIIAGHHTNKLSMVSIVDKELLVDHQGAMFSARGASALVAAARFVLGMQPMTRKLWEEYFKDHVTDGSTFVHYAGLIEAKSNYNVVEDDIVWLRKNSVDVQTTNGKEKTGVFESTDLNKITKAKNKLKAAMNEQYARGQIPVIRNLMEENNTDIISLNSAVLAILPEDPRIADESINEATIKTSVRRKLENGLHGKEKDLKRGGMTQMGIEADDGYNYWVKRDHSKEGATKVFIERGKDFKR